MGAIARLNSARLGIRDAGKNGQPARANVAGHGWREIVQGALEQVGEHEVGRHAPENGMREA